VNQYFISAVNPRSIHFWFLSCVFLLGNTVSRVNPSAAPVVEQQVAVCPCASFIFIFLFSSCSLFSFSLNCSFSCDTVLVVLLQSRQMRATVFLHLGNALYYQKCKIKLAWLTSGKLMSHLIEFSIYFKAVYYLSLMIYLKYCAVLEYD